MKAPVDQWEVQPLFSNPLYIAQDQMTDSIRDAVASLEFYEDPMKNNGENSKSQLVLDEIPELKRTVEKHMTYYVHEVLSVHRRFQLRHTCSWATRHKTGNKAHKHSHCHSLWSGVIYIKTSPNCGRIAFHNDGHRPTYINPTVQPELYEHTVLNSTEWTIEPEDGMIVLFPSTVEHSVDVSRSLTDRYSVAFNYWLHGEFGDFTNKITL